MGFCYGMQALRRGEAHQATRLAVIQLTMFGSHEPAL